MDPFTLVVSCALAAAILAASMGLLYLSGARQRCLLDWSAAGACFLVSSLCAVRAIQQGGGHVLLSSIGNAIYIAGHCGILAGLRRQLGHSAGWKWIAAGGVLVAAVHALPFVQASAVHRLCLFTPVVAAINLAAARLLWRHPDHEARIAGTPLVVTELFFILELVLRTVYAVFGAALPAAVVSNQFLRTSGSLFVLVFLSVTTMSCAQVVLQQRALARRPAAMTDVLTGWPNRRALVDIADREFARCRRAGTSLHVIVFDIDHFKVVNERHGHASGDAALCHVSTLAAGALRGCDALFRTGGAEFAALLGALDARDARAVAECLRARIESHPLQAGGRAVALTVSAGMAALDPADATWEDLLARAASALYHARQHGRNRVSVANGAGAIAAQAAA